jgi:hypothetical protein
MKLLRHAALSITATATLAIAFAPTSAADLTTRLKSAIDAARSDAGCPPFESDRVLNDVSQRAIREVAGWINHTGTVIPPEDTGLIPANSIPAVLIKSGYTPLKARLLNGYGDYLTGGNGDNDAKAIKAAVLQGMSYEVFSDCTYTKYGFSTLNDDGSQGSPSSIPKSFTVTLVIIAGG